MKKYTTKAEKNNGLSPRAQAIANSASSPGREPGRR
jgi:hypothetical protein